jgi:hypothetical protein
MSESEKYYPSHIGFRFENPDVFLPCGLCGNFLKSVPMTYIFGRDKDGYLLGEYYCDPCLSVSGIIFNSVDKVESWEREEVILQWLDEEEESIQKGEYILKDGAIFQVKIVNKPIKSHVG